jgi:hypothetical protein
MLLCTGAKVLHLANPLNWMRNNNLAFSHMSTQGFCNIEQSKCLEVKLHFYSPDCSIFLPFLLSCIYFSAPRFVCERKASLETHVACYKLGVVKEYSNKHCRVRSSEKNEMFRGGEWGGIEYMDRWMRDWNKMELFEQIYYLRHRQNKFPPTQILFPSQFISATGLNRYTLCSIYYCHFWVLPHHTERSLALSVMEMVPKPRTPFGQVLQDLPWTFMSVC